jgi:pSer/pThr/pTyr-binding forkhead associated (FHA) protein
MSSLGPEPRGLLERPTTRSGELIVEVREGAQIIAHRAVTAHAIIGRSPEAQIRLDRGMVSRQHAEVLCDPFGRWWIRDMGSRNGITCGNHRITERMISHGDVCQIGDFTLRFQISEITDDDAPHASMNGSADFVRVSDQGGSAGISTAREFGSPKVAASHLSLLLETVGN